MKIDMTSLIVTKVMDLGFYMPMWMKSVELSL